MAIEDVPGEGTEPTEPAAEPTDTDTDSDAAEPADDDGDGDAGSDG